MNESVFTIQNIDWLGEDRSLPFNLPTVLAYDIKFSSAGSICRYIYSYCSRTSFSEKEKGKESADTSFPLRAIYYFRLT
jgi:hypothetical protein